MIYDYLLALANKNASTNKEDTHVLRPRRQKFYGSTREEKRTQNEELLRFSNLQSDKIGKKTLIMNPLQIGKLLNDEPKRAKTCSTKKVPEKIEE